MFVVAYTLVYGVCVRNVCVCVCKCFNLYFGIILDTKICRCLISAVLVAVTAQMARFATSVALLAFWAVALDVSAFVTDVA